MIDQRTEPMASGAPPAPAVAIHSAITKAVLLTVAIASLAWFVFVAKALVLKYPPIWPDEGILASPATNLLQHGVLSTSLFGMLPGVGHTYWMPPIYFFYLASVFRFTGPGIVAMRFASTAAGMAVLALTYLLAIRTGLGRWASLLPVSLVALDAVFLRGALIGRPDMLALALILFALWVATRSLDRWSSFLTGIACALAALTHPVGVVAPAGVVLWRLFMREGRTTRSLVLLLAGIAVPLLPWLAYIGLDSRTFTYQFGRQLALKSAPHGHNNFVLRSFFHLVGQYAFEDGRPIDIVWAIPVWFIGLVGLGDTELTLRGKEAPERQSVVLLCICQALILGVIVWSSELWYAVYAIPITAIGLCHLLNNYRSFAMPGWQRIAVACLVFWVAAFVISNLQHTLRVRHLENVVYNSETDYGRWCGEISRKLPAGSKVLLSIIPDPYFGLRARSDLIFREFLPEEVTHDLSWAYMSDADYAIVGSGLRSPSLSVEKFIQSNGDLTAVVGTDEVGYMARIYRIKKATPIH